MKTIFRSAIIVSAVVLAASCGNSTKNTETQQVAEIVPTVSVVAVSSREVPQTATYTSTVQAFVKNNIAPQMAGRITKINVEIGDFVKKGQVLAEIDKVQLQQVSFSFIMRRLNSAVSRLFMRPADFQSQTSMQSSSSTMLQRPRCRI